MTNIFIEPLLDNLIEFEESATITLIRTNGYLVPSDSESATVWIGDNFGSNIFTVVATNLDSAAGIGYHPGTNSLIVSVNSFTNADVNFIRIDTNGVISPWSAAHGNSDEKKLTIVQTTTNGFTRGEIFFGTDINGVVGWISADGTDWTNNWATLTTDTNSATSLLRGSLQIDQAGTFGGDLICVTGGNSGSDGGEVWRVTSAKTATRLTKIESLAPHLEGVITLTNSPWSGRIVTGAESELPPVVYAIDTNAVVTSFDLGIEPEDFDLVQTNQDLYCLDQGDADNNIPPRLLKLSKALLTNFWGDLLITQEGAQHLDPHAPKKEGKLFFVHWDSSTTNFVVRRVSQEILFEHATFAPITLPNL